MQKLSQDYVLMSVLQGLSHIVTGIPEGVLASIKQNITSQHRNVALDHSKITS